MLFVSIDTSRSPSFKFKCMFEYLIDFPIMWNESFIDGMGMMYVTSQKIPVNTKYSFAYQIIENDLTAVKYEQNSL